MTRVRASYLIAGVFVLIGCASSDKKVATDSAAARGSSAPPAPTSQAQATATNESFRAVGQEPGWLLTISDSLRLQWDYDAQRVTVAVPTLQTSTAGRTYAFVHHDTAFTVRVSDPAVDTPCADAMSAHQYPSTVNLQIGDRTMKGCGGDPAGMIRGDAWSIDSLEGKPLVPGSSITIQFAADGSVTGTAGCNRYRGSFVVRGSELVIGPAASTRMACNPDVDGQESRFLAAIAKPLVFFVEQGVLHMTRDNNTVATARRR